jgi:NAD(P)-dependent dehydrogenase (short-subunit alcohol dehydrogenase family)
MSHTVVITGGSKGIGWELVKVFAKDGYKVISGSRSVREDVPKDITNNIKQIVTDVKSRGDHLKLVKAAVDWNGTLDCYTTLPLELIGKLSVMILVAPFRRAPTFLHLQATLLY